MSASFRRTLAADLHKAYASGEVSPVDVTRRALDWATRCEREEPSLDAFVILDEDRAIEQAMASQERWQAGKQLGPFDGVPVAIKDEFHVAGYPTAAGTAFLGTRAQPFDCPIVARLREAGAIIIGKTSMHEIGLGGSGVNPKGLTARNPYASEYMTGGSSSGSGAAVSAGVVPVALGSDAGGSIRIPASFCGVYGIKPTYGRIPTAGGELLSKTLDHTGPLGASLQELADFIDITAGADEGDEASMLAPAHEAIGEVVAKPFEELRLAWCPEMLSGAQDDVIASFHNTLDALRERGAKIQAVSIPYHDLIQPVGYMTIASEGAASQQQRLRRFRDKYSPPTRLLLAVGARVTVCEYMQAQRVRSLIKRGFLEVLESFDAFVSPTTGCVAKRLTEADLTIGAVDSDFNAAVSQFTFAGNITGLPAVSIPAGLDRNRLPLSFQIMGRPWAEAEVLSIAAAVDQVTPEMPEPIHYQALLAQDA